MGRFLISYHAFAAVMFNLLVITCCSGPGIEHLSNIHKKNTYLNFNVSVKDWDYGGAKNTQDVIDDINIYVFRNGELEGYSFSDGGKPAGIYLESGKTYSIYALANTGKTGPPDGPEDDWRESVFSIDDVAVIDNANVPMAASGKITVEGAYFTVSVQLVRAAARIGLRVDSSGHSSFRPVSARLVNPASEYRPFIPGHRAEAVFNVFCTASSQDLSDMASGRIWYLNVLENCQGILMPGNTDSRRKVPENLPPDKAYLCTYIEVEGCLEDEKGQTVRRIYRFCLGRDPFSDFNVDRNSHIIVCLNIHGPGPEDFSWETGRSDTHSPDIRFLASGEDGVIVYTDCHGEIIRAREGDRSWNDVIYGENIFVMAGDAGALAYSPDGISWTHVESPENVYWKALAYGDGRFIASGYGETPVCMTPYSQRLSGHIAVSENGREWDFIRMDDCCWNDVEYGNGMFMATGYRIKSGVSFSTGRVILSVDGKDWSEYNVSSRDYPCLVYGNGEFLAMDKGTYIRSSDGMIWSDPETIGFPDIVSLAYGSGVYVAAGSSGILTYSLDGESWTVVSRTDARWKSVSSDGSGFLVAGMSGRLMYSSGGKEWEKVETGISTDINCACMMP